MKEGGGDGRDYRINTSVILVCRLLLVIICIVRSTKKKLNDYINIIINNLIKSH